MTPALRELWDHALDTSVRQFRTEYSNGDYVTFTGRLDHGSVGTSKEGTMTFGTQITQIQVIERGNKFDKQGAD